MELTYTCDKKCNVFNNYKFNTFDYKYLISIIDKIVDVQQTLFPNKKTPTPFTESIKKKAENISTEFVNDHFISNPFCLQNFLNMINYVFTTVINEYGIKYQLPPNKIKFIYKGGNLLKLKYIKFLQQINIDQDSFEIIDRTHILEKDDFCFVESSENSFYNFFADGFKNSDCDFQISVNTDIIQTISNDDIISHLQLISYYCLNEIRYVFSQSPERFFSIYKKNTHDKKKLMNKYKNELQSSCKTMNINKSDIKNISIKGLYPLNPVFTNERKDFIMNVNYTYSDNKIEKMEQTIDNNLLNRILPGTNILSTYDTQFPFYVSWNMNIEFNNMKFSLVRMKMNTALEFNNGQKMNIGGELIDVSIIMHTYNPTDYVYVNIPNRTLKLCIYSNLNLMNDLYFIVFQSTNNQPWTAPKYEKRLLRYLFLIYDFLFKNKSLDIFSDFENTDINQLHNDIKIHIQTILITLQILDNNVQVNSYKQLIYTYIDIIKDHQEEINTSSTFLNISNNDLLFGGSFNIYRNKYLKYKTKYIQMKNLK
jgi:hypothetical protein